MMKFISSSCCSIKAGISVVFLGACITMLSGCEILSICTYPSDKLITKDALAVGVFNALGVDDSLEITKDGLGYRFMIDGHVEYLEFFELDGYTGFCSRPAMAAADELSSFSESQRSMVKDIQSHGIYPWRFGAFEKYGDAFVMLTPMDGVEKYCDAHNIFSIRGDVDLSAAEKSVRKSKREGADVFARTFGRIGDMSDSDNHVLVITPDQLEEMISELLAEDMMLPMVYLPENDAKEFDGMDEEDILDALRVTNKLLVDRIEQIVGAFEAREKLEEEAE